MRNDSQNGHDRISQAQQVTSYAFSDGVYPRIPWGSEQNFTDFHSSSPICPGCRVTMGLLHALGCKAEECPRCGGQRVSCDCAAAE